ncbi:MAG: phosphatidate cytidylyltransferase [Planctomycetia bacterium]|nr:phosphatidate cytidylyltransferase [Planctomycetia bacterium]
MLYWRLLIGVPIIMILVFLCFLDAQSQIPGLYLMPFFLVCVGFICKEVLELLNAGGLKPRRLTVYLGTFWSMILCWFACYHYSLGNIQNLSTETGWKTAALACVYTLVAMAGGVLIAFIGEMARFKSPGGNIINLAGAVFAFTYIGMLGCFMIMLRIAYGIEAILSLIIVTKFGDSGAYAVGRLLGRHKMVPGLSPGKTVEGAIGGLTFAIFGSWFSMNVFFPFCVGQEPRTLAGVLIFGLLVGLAGVLGDLAESLIKRDVNRKDSGHFVPGFGGFLDIFDSLLMAAPVAFGLWAFHII